jgi:hypothetical protein
MVQSNMIISSTCHKELLRRLWLRTRMFKEYSSAITFSHEALLLSLTARKLHNTSTHTIHHRFTLVGMVGKRREYGRDT